VFTFSRTKTFISAEKVDDLQNDLISPHHWCLEVCDSVIDKPIREIFGGDSQRRVLEIFVRLRQDCDGTTYYLSAETEDAKGIIDYPYPGADKKNMGREADFKSLVGKHYSSSELEAQKDPTKWILVILTGRQLRLEISKQEQEK
jgi:hypothetical protein